MSNHSSLFHQYEMKYTTYGSNGIPSSSNWAYSSCMWGGADPLLTNHSIKREKGGEEKER